MSSTIGLSTRLWS